MSKIITAAEHFTKWADAYLYRFYHKVIAQWGTSNCDISLWKDLYQFAKDQKFDQDVNFNDMHHYIVAAEREIDIDGPKFKCFRNLLEAVYNLELAKQPEVLDDFLSEVFEKIVVDIDPIVSENKVKTDTFDKDVEKVLAGGRPWKSADYISSLLKISIYDFEHWVAKRTDISFKKGETPGVHFYALKTRLEIPAFGTKEFQDYIIKLWSEDDEAIWKSPAALAKKIYYSDPKLFDEFEKWLEDSPAFVSRLSQKDKATVYYCPFDLITKKPKEAEKKEDKKTEEPKGQVTVKNPRRSISEQDYYMVAMLHNLGDQLVYVMNKYGNRLAVRNIEILAPFARAQKDLLSGIALLKTELKVDDDCLPDIKL